ncbi:hypothetical protein Pelo_16246 [Pelomyxa schiedti]|nr:hypothetical protein Pelo_16246 [Pelomyxa schiedti]
MARGGGIGGGGLTVGPGVVIGDQSAATSGIGIVSGNGTGMGAANVSESGAAEQEQEQVQQVMVQDKPVQVCSKIPIVTDLQVPVTSDMRVGDFISLLQDKVRSSIPLPSGSGDDLVEIVPKISLFVPDLRNACSLDTKISELMKGNDVILEMIPESEWVRTQSAQDLKPLEIEIAPDPVASGAEASYSVNNPESALHESPQQQPEAPPPRRGRGRGRKKTTGDSDNPDTPKPRRGRGSGSASAAAAASSSEWTQQQWSQQQMQQHWQTQTQSQSQSQSQQGQWGSQEDYSPRKRQPSENSPITDLNGDPEEPDRKQLRTVSNMSCHRCKTRRPKCMVCPKNEKHKFCYACMERHHSTTRIPDVGCPVCTRTCTCAQCRKKV